MIIRIMEEGQYRLETADQLQQFEALDDSLHTATQAGDQIEFARLLGQLIAFIKTHGHPVPFTEIVPSDMIVPAADMTLAEAAEVLATTPDTP